MAFVFIRRVTIVKSIADSHWLSPFSRRFSSSIGSTVLGHDRAYSVSSRLHLSPLFPKVEDDSNMKGCKIELMDDDSWHVSSGLADAWRGNYMDKASRLRPDYSDNDDSGVVNSVALNKDEPDFDEIEDMRIHGKLFYKLDKDSKEYEEYKYDFHRRKSPKNEKARNETKQNKKNDNPSQIEKNKDIKRDSLPRRDRNEHSFSRSHEVESSCIVKKQRTLTFNQQTGPYHEPFCLDIYISTSSVRASIIHRATSNVVAVSHSISKDMKFDLGSTKNKIACATVGEVLARKALADDIHNVIYTPRKGEKIEGKIHIVLKAIVDGGVDVKVKLKQNKTRKTRQVSPKTRDSY